MNYLRVEFELNPDLHELFIAELIDLDFYGFEQLDNKLIAYIESNRFNDSNREYLEQLIAAYAGGSFLEFEEIPDKNWNESWEQTIEPQRVGRFLIRPTWSNESPGKDEILLEIDPKMSFGTGYHATTRLILRNIQEIDFTGKSVLDAGTGTGILAIASIKLGAKKAVGFDIDPWSRDNARENILINNVDHSVEIRFGGVETIDEFEKFDIVLANINRNALLEMLPELVKHTTSGGKIYLSGLLYSDEDQMREKIAETHLEVADIKQEQEWILIETNKVKE